MHSRSHFLLRAGYELAVFFAFILLVFLPIHRLATVNLNVTRTLDFSHILIQPPSPFLLKPGQALPTYRFCVNWRTEIGHATIQSISEEGVVCSFDSEKMRWPMGRHGTVVGREGNLVRVDVGSSLLLKPGDRLILFDGRQAVGRLELAQVFDDFSLATVLENSGPLLEGLSASEYTVMTQVCYLRYPILVIIEIVMILAGLSFLFWHWIFKKRFLLDGVGVWLRDFFMRAKQRKSLWVISHLVLGAPFTWFLASFPVTGFWYVSNTFFPQQFSFSAVEKNQLIVWAAAVSYVLYVVIFWLTRQAPIPMFWRSISYRKPISINESNRFRVWWIWFLHLFIAYAFSSNLLFFIQNNLYASLELGWKDAVIPLEGHFNLFNPQAFCLWAWSLIKVAGYMLTHTPHFASATGVFHVFRYCLWAVTIVGCLLGYGHSVLGILWGKKIRNLDFTFPGWLTNGFCYPLFGVVIWRMIPYFVGRDPIVPNGPWRYLMLSVELLFNLLYATAVWSMGKKFGVMTDKGVQDSRLYSAARHPMYTAEAFMFLLVEMNGLSGGREWFSISMFFFLYYIRSEREDNFMQYSNPAYPEYQKKVPYKFIPGIY